MDKIALVTGAAQGIGWGIAQALAGDVTAIILADIQRDLLAERADALRATGTKVHFRCLDIGDPHEVDDLLGWSRREAGVVDILVNNAAISGLRDGAKVPLHETTQVEWERCVAINLSGPFYMARAFAPGMIDQGWGRIVNISSAAGRTFVPLASGAYSATKAGVAALTWGMASDLGPHGITVNAVAPGRIETPTGAAVKRSSEYLDRIPRRRSGVPDDIAGAVRYLVSDAADYVTGTTIDVHGGLYMGP
ncbi:SDR family NAD(P)-dependent oxidoreductase [Sphingomonas sp. AX6]|uniref:SDR family NAD(P)-dependent oxidoreductase n=1 Tax=Sphingomonas sp. AX6 TaxID=2653171 RepID=UPI0012F36851|nr:SDR family NAD(P)-dependent oxidoreductase [Sphingomonas sp. AX6]VXC85027.1 SDR family oxidoreductase [Sphingomonas sp. AX6]